MIRWWIKKRNISRPIPIATVFFLSLSFPTLSVYWPLFWFVIWCGFLNSRSWEYTWFPFALPSVYMCNIYQNFDSTQTLSTCFNHVSGSTEISWLVACSIKFHWDLVKINILLLIWTSSTALHGSFTWWVNSTEEGTYYAHFPWSTVF